VPNSLKNVEIDPMENFSTGMHLTKIENALELSVGAIGFCADPGNFAPCPIGLFGAICSFYGPLSTGFYAG
jgi:hypothetical protein